MANIFVQNISAAQFFICEICGNGWEDRQVLGKNIGNCIDGYVPHPVPKHLDGEFRAFDKFLHDGKSVSGVLKCLVKRQFDIRPRTPQLQDGDSA